MSESDDRFRVPPPPPVDPFSTSQNAYVAPEPPATQPDLYGPSEPVAPPSEHHDPSSHPSQDEPPIQASYEAPAVPAFVTGEPLPAAGPPALAETASVDGTPLATRIADELIAWLKTLASAAVYATLIVTFGFQVARVEGQSMAPTLQDQDRLIVNKLAYRLGDPQIGDIVMLHYPNDPRKSFVKRVIGAEGDQIRIVNGKVYRNDVLMDDSFVPEEFKSHDDWGPEVIPEGYYFVMGDHRNNSSDSRHWKFVPKKYIIGRVQLRWWPLPEARTF
jgi:signal peptidase I